MGGGAADSGQAAERLDDGGKSDGSGASGGWGWNIASGLGSIFGTDVATGLPGAPPKIDRGGIKSLPQQALDGYLTQYPGYGSLWSYSLTDGVQITAEGWAVLALAGVGVWWVLR